MRKRTKARQLALQILYCIDITGDDSTAALDKMLPAALQNEEPEVKQFSSDFVKGILKNRDKIDKKISEYAKNWKLKRVAVVERNVLRQGCFELLYRADIPPKVAINEAIELAKRFSGQEAGKFVNGILDKIRKDIG